MAGKCGIDRMEQISRCWSVLRDSRQLLFPLWHVYEVNKPNQPYFAASFGVLGPTAVDSGNHFNHNRNGNGPIYIELNNAPSNDLNQNQHQGIACQEQGHVLGLSHRDQLDDCMFDDDDIHFPKLPSDPHDYNVVSNIYDHGS